jgi:hypothetical protein
VQFLALARRSDSSTATPALSGEKCAGPSVGVVHRPKTENGPPASIAQGLSACVVYRRPRFKSSYWLAAVI